MCMYIQKLDSAPKLTTEMLEEKQREARERKKVSQSVGWSVGQLVISIHVHKLRRSYWIRLPSLQLTLCVLLCALQELQKRAHTRLSRRERLRREIMEAKEMELPDQVNI